MNLTPFGFGTYRITSQNQEHIAALVSALQKGVRLIDTSTNYGFGDAERAVSIALARSGIPRENVTIVSKAGYIQGPRLQRLMSGQEQIEETVPYPPHCYHSIHPDFIAEEIDRSLARLGVEKIDIYLLHNPEYFLMHRIQTPEDISAARKEMSDRIRRAFAALEEAVREGRIGGYGISSNAFSKSRDDLHFLPYERLLDLAKEAAAEAGNDTHHFTTIQLPINLLEQEGLHCAAWAKAHGLQVLANRPLNAFDEGTMYRLAEYPEPDYYEESREALLLAADTYSMSELRTTVTDLDALAATFIWPGAVDDTLQRRTIPFIRGILARLPDPQVKQAVIPLLNPFLEAWRQKALHHCGEAALTHLKSKGFGIINHPLQRHALTWLTRRPEIDTVLVGMRKKEYVEEVLNIE